MARATIVKKIEFEAAHFLPKSSYQGKCNTMHGHSYKCEVGISGEINEHTGMVIDFSVLKKSMKNCVDCLDHKLLNDIITNPTTENIVLWIWEYLVRKERLYPFFDISYIKVLETSSCYCIIKKEDIIKLYYKWIIDLKISRRGKNKYFNIR